LAGFRLKWEIITNLDTLEKRVGDAYFSWIHVQDIFNSPAKLKSLKSQGLIKEVGVIKKSNSCIWQITFEGRRRLSSFRGDSTSQMYHVRTDLSTRYLVRHITEPHGTEVNDE